MFKLKTMFIPLAPTTSTISILSSPSPSPLTSPLDDGITTVRHYIYIHTQNPGPMPPPRGTTSTGRRTSNANPIVSTPAPVLTDAVQKCVDTAAEAIAIHKEAKLVFMQGIVKRILREAYREPTTPPSVGTSLAQSVFAGVSPPSRGPSPYFVTQPNYHNGQFHQYYPPEKPIPISQSPTTSATTTSAGMNTTQTSVTSTTSLTSKTSTPSATTVHCSSHATVSREAHRTHTVFCFY